MSETNPHVDWFFEKTSRWKEEYNLLRNIVLACDLDEELKWGCPCYTFQKGNVVLIHGFKEYCALLFHKGALMKDEKGILIQQTVNVQATKQIRFKSVSEISNISEIIKNYILEALEIEKKGLKIEYKKVEDYKISDEFKAVLEEMPELKLAFYKLTPGRQKNYILYFAQAKQAKTRTERMVNCFDKILSGKGLMDE